MNNMEDEKKNVLAAFQKMQQAMIDKDLETMRALCAEEKTFTHMSGRTQTREEFFSEIMDGTLNYFHSDIHNPVIEIDRDRAVLKAAVTLDAKVYGMKGTWTLNSRTHFRKINGEWIQCNEY